MIRLFNTDNMNFMRSVPDKFYELAIVDPPYGLGSKLTSGGTWSVKWQDKGADWDKAPSIEYFNELFRISKNWIIWGGNYFIQYLPNCRHFIAWHKPYMDGMHSMSNVELALSSFDLNAKKVSFNKDLGNEDRIHVTQKPIKLYKWLLKNYAKEGDKIFDSHSGSLSIAIACGEMGFDLDACELDGDYFKESVARVQRHFTQSNAFMKTPEILVNPSFG